jgi:NitT/TauT family transport system ATP-binding protein
MTYLEVQHIDKRFAQPSGNDYTNVLADVSFNVERGEFICLIGPSGCGKSTLLRIMHGLIPSDGGQVMLNGQAVTQPGLDRGMVFQQFNLLPWRTAAGNVEFGLEAQRIPKQERRERVLKYLELVGLSGFTNYYPAQLSGGMQQRVGLARALAIEPDILLMDEPFGALDAMTRELMQNELMRIWSLEKRTAIFVTHDIEEAVFLADRIIVMSSRPGKIVEVVNVPFARPRDENLRISPEFSRLRGAIWEKLKAAAGNVDRLET